MTKLRTLISLLFICLLFLVESDGFIFLFNGSNFRLAASAGVSAAVLVGGFALIQGLQEKFNINIEYVGDELEEKKTLFDKKRKRKHPILKGPRKHIDYSYNLRRNENVAHGKSRKVYRYPREVREGLTTLEKYQNIRKSTNCHTQTVLNLSSFRDSFLMQKLLKLGKM